METLKVRVARKVAFGATALLGVISGVSAYTPTGDMSQGTNATIDIFTNVATGVAGESETIGSIIAKVIVIGMLLVLLKKAFEILTTVRQGAKKAGG